MASSNDDILRSLNLIQATLSLAFAPQIDEARLKVRADAVSRAILDATTDWQASTDVQESVAKSAKVSTRSVRSRLPEMVARGFLESRGSERRLEFRSTGII